jgi:peptidoglycan-associated lipoprotein
VLLRAAASWWKANPRFRLVIEGYADAHGSDAYNIGIAARRALAVRAQLVKLGVPRDRIVTAIYGEAKPRASNPYAAANRVVVVYATTLSPSELVGRDAPPRLPIVWS